MQAVREEIKDPAVWSGHDFKSKDDITVELQPAHLQEIDEDLAAAKKAGTSLETMELKDFQLKKAAPLLAKIRDTLQNGNGIVIIKGIDVSRYSQQDLEMIYWGIGTHLGTGVSQSVLGDRLGHVKDFTVSDPHARAYRNKQELTPHTDLADIVGLMCLKSAKSGGISIATSALAVYNAFVTRFPQLLDPLLEGFFYHRRGEQLPGESPINDYRTPVFSAVDDQVSCRYVRSYIETAAKESGKPLTTLQADALNCLERLTYELAFEFTLEPGEIYLINNYTVLHARTAFENWPEPERARHLLRLWLVAPDWRKLAPNIERGRRGISAQAGKSPSFEGSFGSGRMATQ